jgi:hypothetical protein
MAIKLLSLLLLAALVQSRGGGSTNTGDDGATTSEFCGNATEACPYCCLDSTQTCAVTSAECAVETDDDYIEQRIFYIIGALFALWFAYKLARSCLDYNRKRKDAHSKLGEE